MLKVKLSYPSSWDVGWGDDMYKKETPARSGNWGNIQYFINEEIDECDYWFVFDNIDGYFVEKTKCPRDNVFFITGEVKSFWKYTRSFLKQFAGIITVRNDINHDNIYKEQHICVWHIKKDYDYLKSLSPVNKTKNLSAIISSSNFQEGHKKRFDFINQLKKTLKDEVDWYGRGVNPINDKWDGLNLYRYSIAIENSCYQDYFTEKILDCFLSYTMPIYYGCPNIYKFFPKESLILIDIHDFEYSINKIKNAIDEKLYEKNFDAIVSARNKILNEISFFPFLSNWINRHYKQYGSRLKKNKVLVKVKEYDNVTHTLKQNLYKYKLISSLRIKGYR